MDDSTLFNLALICALLGLCALFSLMYFEKLPVKDFDEITADDLGKKISTYGVVDSIRISASNKTTFIELTQECSLTVVAFDKINTSTLKRGDFLKIEGVVQEYLGKKELVADSVDLYNSTFKLKK